jgi:hypothetical protein
VATREENLTTAADTLAEELAALARTSDLDRATKAAALLKQLRDLAAEESAPFEEESRETT